MPPKKRVLAVVKIQLPAGGATPAPPVGTALGPHGVQTMDFCKQYNAATENQRGSIVPVEISWKFRPRLRICWPPETQMIIAASTELTPSVAMKVVIRAFVIKRPLPSPISPPARIVSTIARTAASCGL